MQKLLVISDPHICEPGEKIIGLDPKSRFERVLNAATTAHPDATALILLGDLTHNGLAAEYEVLHSILEKKTIPVIPMLGNHDRRETFREIFTSTKTDENGFLQYAIDLPGHRVITLDTLDGPPYDDVHHSGRLCPDRMTWLARALAGSEDRMPLVFMHHPPFETGIVGMDNINLTDGHAVLTLIAAKRRAHLFCGHVHRTISGSTQGVPWTIFKSSAHQGVLDLETNDSSLSVDEPGAYGVLLLRPYGVVAHSEDVGAAPAKPPERASSSV